MNKVRCPSCGREVPRHGDVCMFCGASLRSAVKKSSPAPAADETTWNPEAAYRRSGGFRLLLIFLLLAAVALIVLNAVQSSSPRIVYTPGELPSSISLPYGLKPGMDLNSVSRCAESAGMVRLGKPYSHASAHWQMYTGGLLFNHPAEYSIAAVDGADGLEFCHTFYDVPASFDAPGPLFRDLKAELSDLYGAPLAVPALSTWLWQQDQVCLALRYVTDTTVEVVWYTSPTENL